MKRDTNIMVSNDHVIFPLLLHTRLLVVSLLYWVTWWKTATNNLKGKSSQPAKKCKVVEKE